MNDLFDCWVSIGFSNWCSTCWFCYRYKEAHAIRHWKETQHCYALELETRRVWDYSGDNYVHRLIQSKTDGKLVELNHHCHHDIDGCCSCECATDPGFSETLVNSKVEAVCLSLHLQMFFFLFYSYSSSQMLNLWMTLVITWSGNTW